MNHAAGIYVQSFVQQAVEETEMGAVDNLARQILADAVADFGGKNLGATDLNNGYVGASITALEMKYCADGAYSKIDFDLSLKQLEESELVKTGPMEMYENKPGSLLAIMAFFSKREFVYLTENGYKAAQKSIIKRSSPASTVHISGGTFNQSPIGIGGVVSQAVDFNIDNDFEVIEQLFKLLASQPLSFGEEGKRNVVDLVSAAKTGDLGKVKPIFQRLFGTTVETTKQVAWGIIVAYASKKLGL